MDLGGSKVQCICPPGFKGKTCEGNLVIFMITIPHQVKPYDNMPIVIPCDMILDYFISYCPKIRNVNTFSQRSTFLKKDFTETYFVYSQKFNTVILTPVSMVGHARKTAESLRVLVFKTGQDLFVKVSLKIPSPNKLKYVQSSERIVQS